MSRRTRPILKCKADGCDHPADMARGFCQRCYREWRTSQIANGTSRPHTFNDALPARPPWSWEGNEAALIAEQEDQNGAE
jgi:hypothetical protein